jgi:uncharacterized protein YbaR (Trm112 family)/SAM-dependent methyltransferase
VKTAANGSTASATKASSVPGRELSALLACPVCHLQLVPENATFRCPACERIYPVVEGVPVLFHPESIYAGTTHLPSGSGQSQRPTRRGWARQLRAYASYRPQLTTLIDDELFRQLNRCTADMAILNLGSGIGLFDGKIAPHLRLINLDVYRNDRTHVLADGHFLPFADGTLDTVVSLAVLEHVQRPWVVAEEIWRVLKPGGTVLIDAPFLYPIHDRHDYFRFTDQGLEILFSRFQKIALGVSGGPSSFVGPFLTVYCPSFVPGRNLQRLTRAVLSLVAWPVKYFDYPLRRSDNLRLAADSFYFIGRKLLQ